MPLPEDRELRGDGRPHVRRFRSHQLELGERLAAFRERYGVTQAEVARAAGARNGSTVSLWESGTTVPDGMLRERLVDLLDGQRWPEVRAVMLSTATGGLPDPWDRAVRWYRRASREQRPRETDGAAVAAVLEELRGVETAGALRHHYCERDGDWMHGVVERCGLERGDGAALRSIKDAAYGLCWLELAHGRRFDVTRSLVPQLPPDLFDNGIGAMLTKCVVPQMR